MEFEQFSEEAKMSGCEGDGLRSSLSSSDPVLRRERKKAWKRRRFVDEGETISSWSLPDSPVSESGKQQQVEEDWEDIFGPRVAMRCSTLLGILTGTLLYLVLGAVVFRTLELPAEEGVYNHLQDMQREFLLNFTCISEENLQALIEEVVDAIGAGVDPSSNSTFVSQWDLASAFFFSGTIVTTIGYGNISPKTEGGQLFCIFYALVGIPMFGILLAGVGDHLGTALRKAVARVEKLLSKWRVNPNIVRVITALFSIALGVGLFIAVPIFVFKEVEGWSYLESAYFVVITLTTVGFGDYVAGTGDSGIEGSEHWYKPLVWFWILLGLAYFVSILAMIGKTIRIVSKQARAEMEALSAHAKNIQNLSVDFRIAGKLDDPFKRHRKKRRHGKHKHDSANGTAGVPGEKDPEQSSQSESESGSDSGASSSSNESKSDGSQPSQVTQTEHMPEGKTVEALKEEEEKEKEARPDPLFSQPLDFFGENLAFIDESSDAVSGKLHLDPLLDPAQKPSLTPSRQPTRRRSRQRRPVPQKHLKVNHAKHHHTHPERKPNGDVLHSPSSPIKP